MAQQYFAHDYNAHNDSKLILLRQQTGLAGIGCYWVLVECLHAATNAIKCQQNLDKRLLAVQVGIEVEELEKLISVMIDLQLMTLTDGILSCDRVGRNLAKREDISAKRSKAGQMSASVQQKATKSTKERKVKEKKLKDLTPLAPLPGEIDSFSEIPKPNEIPKPPQILTWPEKLDRPDCRETWAQWMKYRQEIKKPLKSLTGQQAALDRWKDDPAGFIGAIRNSMANGYQGVFEAPPPPNQAKTPIKPPDPNANRPRPKEWEPPWEIDLSAKNKPKAANGNGHQGAQPADVGKLLAALPPIEPGEVQQ